MFKGKIGIFDIKNNKINHILNFYKVENGRFIKIFYINYQPQNINEFQNKKIIAFAGIGSPENFFDLLKNNNLNIINEIKFPDHHKYSEKELENLLGKIKENNTILLTTEKDYLRIPKNFNKKIEFLKIKVEIENKNQFIENIKKII